MTVFFMKVIEQNNERLVAACDKEVMEMELDSHGVKIKVNPKFYGDDLVTQQELLDVVKHCTSANVIGIKIIELLLKNRMIHEDAILWLKHPSKKNEKEKDFDNFDFSFKHDRLSEPPQRGSIDGHGVDVPGTADGRKWSCRRGL